MAWTWYAAVVRDCIGAFMAPGCGGAAGVHMSRSTQMGRAAEGSFVDVRSPVSRPSRTDGLESGPPRINV
ncbi:hypothetical protein GCM10010502_19110 [Kitasatospora aureofaciens]|uniref:Uncharacterized protein n=1 Tax=Kitasatospora aureofaciens TaxID=1894 RepID=A0A8H9LKS6_KITAU|nr:hypothetical protein GCM10010502_19110 [Kitasatospora aureofaciens]